MDESDFYERDELDEIIDGSDTDTTMSTTASSFSSGMFERKHFVLELHELQKDEPQMNRRPDSKVKKFKKKLKVPPVIKRNESSDTSENDDVSLPPSVTDATSKEQYFDAHESYYGLSGNSDNDVTSSIDDESASGENFQQYQEPKSLIGHSVEIRTSTPSKENKKLVKRPEKQV